MEKLSAVELESMSRGEIAERFNYLVDVLDRTKAMVKELPQPNQMEFLSGALTPDQNDLANQFLRIYDRLGRPFAATCYSETGVKAVKFERTLYMDERASNMCDISIPVAPGDVTATFRWILRVFFCGICEGYTHGAPRRIEAYTNVCAAIVKAVADHVISEDDGREMQIDFDAINRDVFPKQ